MARGGARPGAGRPLKYGDERTRKVGLWLTESIDLWLSEEAERQGVSRSEVVQRILERSRARRRR